MDRTQFAAVFPGRRRVLLAVVHTIAGADGVSNAVDQVRVATENGADGVFLIPASHPVLPMCAVVAAVRDVFPALFVGVNMMTLDPFDSLPASINAVWTDRGVDFKGTHAIVHSEAAVRFRNTGGLHFVGWLFKGMHRSFPVEAVAAADKEVLVHTAARALHALGEGVVCCTSGAGTGTPLELDRHDLYRAALGDTTVVAVASGVTVDNVHEHIPFVDVFMVGTGIEQGLTDPHEIQFYADAGIPAAKVGILDPVKVRALANAIHACT